MIPHNAPAELKAYDNWIPLDGKAPAGDKRWSLPENRWKYGELTVAIQTGMLATGMGYCFMDDDPFVVIDLDDPDKMKDGEYVIASAANREAAKKMQKRILTIFQHAYVERSNSGKGYHIVMRGELPQGAGRATKCPGVEIYAYGQYTWITGNTVKSDYNLDGHQEALSELVEYVWRTFGQNSVRVPATDLDMIDDGVRRLDLSDDQVITALRQRSRVVFAAYNGGEGFGPSWSDDTLMLIGELDKITGDPHQINRILFSSPRLLNAGYSEDRIVNGVLKRGEDRYERTVKMFGKELTNIRKHPKQIAFIERRLALPKFDPTYVPPPKVPYAIQKELDKLQAEALEQALKELKS